MVDNAAIRQYLWQLIVERETVASLLHILDLDISIRRKLEELRKLPFPDKRSVTVEMAREELQAEMTRLRAEIDAAMNLLEQRNDER